MTNRSQRRQLERSIKKDNKSLLGQWSKTLEREARKVVKQSITEEWTEFEPCPIEGTPFLWAYKNNRYTVMGYMPTKTEIGYIQRAAIRHNTGAPIHSWTDIQRIKNEIFNEEAHAVEYYPKASELVDDFNIYHLWVLDADYKAPFSFSYAPNSLKSQSI